MQHHSNDAPPKTDEIERMLTKPSLAPFVNLCMWMCVSGHNVNDLLVIVEW